MEWDYFFDSENGILEVKVQGEIKNSELNQMAAENLLEIRRHNGFKCLLNYTGSTKDLGIFDMYFRPKEIGNIGVTQIYRIALLIRLDQFENYKFMENVYKNNGFEFEIFTDKPAAIKFLMKTE